MVAASVVFFRSDREGCAFYRCEQPAAALMRAGVFARVTHHPQARGRGGEIEWLRTHGDALVFQRPMIPQSPDLIRVGVREGRRVLVELDDDIWSMAPHNPSAHAFTREVLDRVAECCRLAHGVIVSTAALAARVRAVTRQPRIFVIPNAVDPALAGARCAAGVPLVFGWAGGASHRADFRVARDGVLALQARPDVAVHFHGDDPLRGTRGPRHITGWVRSVPDHYRRIADFDAAMAPLENSRFNRSKSALKWMEYALHGTPAVLSDVHCYRELADDGATALFAGSAAQFARHLRRLIEDAALRTAIGEAARAEVLARHTIDRRVPLYMEALGV